MLVDIKMFLKMSLSLTHVITVVPLRKPREKLWLKRSCVKEKANQITQVLEKFEKVDDNRDDSLLRPRRNSKNESDNQPAVSNLKGVSRESPGMSAPLETKGMVKRAAKSCNFFCNFAAQRLDHEQRRCAFYHARIKPVLKQIRLLQVAKKFAKSRE